MALFSSSQRPTAKTVAPHEQVVFYPSFGARSPDGKHWTLVIQGSVFDPRVSWIRRRPLLGVIRRVLRMDKTEVDFFRTRMRQFLMFGRRGRTVSVHVGGRDVVVGESDYMGLFRGEVTLTRTEVQRLLDAQPEAAGWLPFRAVLPGQDERIITGGLQLIDPTGVSIISDVDDTIKHSNVVNRRDLFRNTFMRSFVSIPGMPELYRDCAAAGAAFHFVSGSPWQLYEPLVEFCRAEGFPAGSFHLKRFRIRDSARKLRRSPQKVYKRATIEPILDAFPKRHFVLVGDSGEQDPEIYGSLLRERPDQIVGIFIRTMRGETRVADRLQAAFAGLDPTRWTTYRDPAEIREALTSLVEQHD